MAHIDNTQLHGTFTLIFLSKQLCITISGCICFMLIWNVFISLIIYNNKTQHSERVHTACVVCVCIHLTGFIVWLLSVNHFCHPTDVRLVWKMSGAISECWRTKLLRLNVHRKAHSLRKVLWDIYYTIRTPCQKCRWQVTPEHTRPCVYGLEWSDAVNWRMVYTEHMPKWQQFHVAPAV